MNYPTPGSTSHDTPIASVGNSFAPTKKATLVLPKNANRNFQVKLSGVWIWMSSVAGGASQISFRLSKDAAGDELLVTDTVGSIFSGTTTAAKGNIVYSLYNLAVDLSESSLYLIAKTNAGTVTIDKVKLSWGF